jgi:hypothetical protein
VFKKALGGLYKKSLVKPGPDTIELMNKEKWMQWWDGPFNRAVMCYHEFELKLNTWVKARGFFLLTGCNM